MAETTNPSGSLHSSLPVTYSLRSVQMLRLIVGFTIIIGAAIFLTGTSWDIQWHTFIGRDRTLIPPHIMMLSGITLGGIAAITAVFIETLWTRTNPLLAKHNTVFADFFHSSLGSYIAGFAALNAAIAFPLDSYWHALYGIDVSIWAPFHIMIITGGGLMALGGAYMLISAAQLALSSGDQRGERIGYVGALLAFATTLGVFTLLLIDANGDQGTISLGNFSINLFPLLSGLLLSWLFATIVYAIPWRWATTSVILIYILFALLFTVFVPSATSALVASEHLSYRRGLGIFSHFSLVTIEGWPLAPIIAAPLIDLFFSQKRRKEWSSTRIYITLVIFSLITCLPILIIAPVLFLELIIDLGGTGFLISMLLGLLSTCTGIWFGRRMGIAMQSVER